MKTTIYLRLAHGSRGPRVSASTTPNYEPIYSGSGYSQQALPTAAFALKVDVPEVLFDRAAQVLAEFTVPEDEAEIAAGIVVRETA